MDLYESIEHGSLNSLLFPISPAQLATIRAPVLCPPVAWTMASLLERSRGNVGQLTTMIRDLDALPAAARAKHLSPLLALRTEARRIVRLARRRAQHELAAVA